MQFTTFATLTLAAVASASPTVSKPVANEVLISLPPGCTTSDIIKCVGHIGGTTAACVAAALELGANVAADLACLKSASSTAENFDECKACIPTSTKVFEN